MIELYDIVEALCPVIGKSLILHRNMKAHPKFKIYKIFEYNLYYLSEDKSKKLLLNKSYTVNVSSDDIMTAWKDTDRMYIAELFKWVYDESRV